MAEKHAHLEEGLPLATSAAEKMPSPSPAPTKRRRTTTTPPTEGRSLGAALRKMLVDHQLGLSINFVLLLGLTHALFPSLRGTVRAFLLLSYPASDPAGAATPSSETQRPHQHHPLSPQTSYLYSQGPRDLYLVAGWIVYFTGIRVFLLDHVLSPLAGALGIRSRKARTRFAEQSYLLLYYLVFWSWGVWLFARDTPAEAATGSVDALLVSLWRDFPRLTLGAEVKLYYLMQMAFWVQQIVVIHLEERRKDHYQMLAHHFVTVGLMVGSYGYRQWRVGTAILVCMDVVDLVFPFAKIMRYMGWQTACDAAFGVFVVAWVVARHVFYLAICWSVYAHTGAVAMVYGTYSTLTGERLSAEGGDKIWEHLLQPILRPEATEVRYNANIQRAFLGLLLALQCITLVWLVMIIRVVIRVLKGEGADDSRSDDEDEEEVEDEEFGAEEQHPHPSAHLTSPAEVVEKPRFIEVEASSEDVTWPVRKGSGTWKKSKGISSGLNLGDHKDILNRIGCLSEEQLAREREKREDTGSPQPRGGRR